jgi:signal transduction histidine kinase
MAAPLGFQPTVRFRGAVDSVISGAPAEDVVAVVRETLSNSARHASATRVEVDVAAEGGEISVVVRDDGVGLGETGRRSGLANLRRRAEEYGGSLTLGPANYADRTTEGTLVQWVIPRAGSR